MSERDIRYATMVDLFVVALMLIAALFITAFLLKGEVGDLQRRVGQLESERR
jgi:hypothetical protein